MSRKLGPRSSLSLNIILKVSEWFEVALRGSSAIGMVWSGHYAESRGLPPVRLLMYEWECEFVSVTRYMAVCYWESPLWFHVPQSECEFVPVLASVSAVIGIVMRRSPPGSRPQKCQTFLDSSQGT